MSKGTRHKKGGQRKGKNLEAMRDSEALRKDDAHQGKHRESEKGHHQKYVAPPAGQKKPS